MAGAYFLESVDRVLKVLDAFTTETPELRLTDLSERLGIPKPQVLRIVSTLEAGGYLCRDPATKRYRLGIRLFQLGMVVRQQLDLRRVAQPVLQRLAAETLETVGLFVADLQGPICVDVIDSPKGLRVFAQLGRRMPWNAGTSAKVILANFPEQQRERILAQGGFKRYTEQTITDPARLRKVLAEIRRTGYHVGIRDLDDDALGIAAPIFDHDGHVTGAISIAAPVSRTSEEEIGRFIDLVRGATAEVSRQLGHPERVGSVVGVAADD
jgi:IclR family transcriptional regulator, KDG regulon repressor